MMVEWEPEALDNIEAIAIYIAADNLGAAIALSDRIIDAVEQNLPRNPKLGRPGRVAGTRELVVHENYIVVYQVRDDRIAVLTVRHAARRWPEKF